MADRQPIDLQDDQELLYWITTQNPEEHAWLLEQARALREKEFGNRVFLRGLIELTSHCARNCYYCGLRRDNRGLERYRLTRDEILSACRIGAKLGLRTFVLQGGEDSWYTDERLERLLVAIRTEFPEHAITLSLGERSKDSYCRLRAAGADRYLLRHETADPFHYGTLHPSEQTLEKRKRCLYALREAGFQVGAGLMVGSPGQTPQTLLKDLRFLQDLSAHMVGIGPFVPQQDTPFGSAPAGSVQQTLRMVALCRLVLPQALLPATTALGALEQDGRIQALQAGANVVMPNLTPMAYREQYAIYDNKPATGEEAAEGLLELTKMLEAGGFVADFSRGDHPEF